MRKLLSYFFACGILAGSLAFLPAAAYAAEDEEVSRSQVASESEMAGVQEVGLEGMSPVYGNDVADGVYEVEVESSSSMFKIVKAELTVEDGEMSAALTLSGTGYLKLFMGTGAEAAAADASACIGYAENEKGQYTYRVPVEALDMPIACAAFSRNREKWYDRQILFQAQSLPSEAVLTELPDYDALRRAAKEKRIAALKAESETGKEAPSSGQEKAEPAFIEMEDGEYAIGVELRGGSGRVAVTSPAGLVVKDGLAWARIEWSSSHYDYMVVGGEKFYPVNTEGYSTFEIPILIFNEEMPVIADTTAMSTPHEVAYSLVFDSNEIMSKGQTPQAAAKRVVYMVIAIIAVCVAVSNISKRRRNAAV